MTDFFDLANADESSAMPALSELRIQQEPALAVFFTSDAEEVRLHYEASEAFRSYVGCPGIGCPLCFIGSAPGKFILLPAYNIEKRAVEVVRVPASKGVGSLMAQLTLVLRRTDLAQTVVLLSRRDNQYRVQTRPLGVGVDNGVAAVEPFIAARDAGLKLASAYPSPTAAELADIERVRTKLQAMGGYTPPPVTPQ